MRITTAKTFATPKKAGQTLARVSVRLLGPVVGLASPLNLPELRWMIAVMPSGRFAPVVFSDKRLPNHGIDFAHFGVTVVG